jgi:hypothetical protein
MHYKKERHIILRHYDGRLDFSPRVKGYLETLVSAPQRGIPILSYKVVTCTLYTSMVNRASGIHLFL